MITNRSNERQVKGKLLASERIPDWEGTDRSFWILVNGVENLKVNGGGMVDGNGEAWWKLSCKIDSSHVRAIPIKFIHSSEYLYPRGIFLSSVIIHILFINLMFLAFLFQECKTAPTVISFFASFARPLRMQRKKDCQF